MLYTILVILQWGFLFAYHYTTNVRRIPVRPIFGIGYFFIVLLLWFAPQPKFYFGKVAPFFFLEISIINMVLGAPFLVVGGYFGLRGVLDLGFLRTSMLREDKLICFDIYRWVRNPQYFGVAMLHVGFSLLLGGLYNMLYSPLMFVAMYLKSNIEEVHLKNVFGEAYEDCFRDIPRFIPRPPH